jgi:hypothetical protein
VSGPGARPGSWQLANRETGRAADCLDGEEGAAVQQYPFLGNLPQQFWSFEDVDDVPVQDAGAPRDAAIDAALPDASTTEDAAVEGPERDAGRPSDASARRDAAGRPAPDEDGEAAATADSGGCALGHTTGPSFAWLSLALLGRRRKRRARAQKP